MGDWVELMMMPLLVVFRPDAVDLIFGGPVQVTHTHTHGTRMARTSTHAVTSWSPCIHCAFRSPVDPSSSAGPRAGALYTYRHVTMTGCRRVKV